MKCANTWWRKEIGWQWQAGELKTMETWNLAEKEGYRVMSSLPSWQRLDTLFCGDVVGCPKRESVQLNSFWPGGVPQRLWVACWATGLTLAPPGCSFSQIASVLLEREYQQFDAAGHAAPSLVGSQPYVVHTSLRVSDFSALNKTPFNWIIPLAGCLAAGR